MRSTFSLQKGFTLIELLVVIAIIGLLSSVVLVALNGARAKGRDARVLQELNQLRNQFEVDYNAGTYALSCSGGSDFCAYSVEDTNGNLSSSGSWGEAYKALAKDIYNLNGGVVRITLKSNSSGGASPATGYAIYARLPSTVNGTGIYVCVDGKGNTLNPAPSEGSDAGPTNSDFCR